MYPGQIHIDCVAFASHQLATVGVMDTAQELYRRTRRTAMYGPIVTLSSGVAKLSGGWFGQSSKGI
jgi:hypothetical protein